MTWNKIMEDLKQEIELVETKIAIYSERDLEMTKYYLDILHKKELELLDLMVNY